jgi:hypothetical protein
MHLYDRRLVGGQNWTASSRDILFCCFFLKFCFLIELDILQGFRIFFSHYFIHHA